MSDTLFYYLKQLLLWYCLAWSRKTKILTSLVASRFLLREGQLWPSLKYGLISFYTPKNKEKWKNLLTLVYNLCPMSNKTDRTIEKLTSVWKEDIELFEVIYRFCFEIGSKKAIPIFFIWLTCHFSYFFFDAFVKSHL